MTNTPLEKWGTSMER